VYICKKCKSNKIKTRPNKSFGKSYTTIVNCKDCGSTDVEKLDPKRGRRRR